MHEKIILANQVPVPEDEIVEYIIDGIPESSLRNQAYIGRITTRASLLKAFEKVTLKDKTSIGGVERRRWGDEDRRASERVGDEKREMASGEVEKCCFNYGQRNHAAVNCPIRAEGPKCFQCGKREHIAAKCAAKQNAMRSVEARVSGKCDKYVKSVNIGNCKPIALIDTGSDICLIRASVFD